LWDYVKVIHDCQEFSAYFVFWVELFTVSFYVPIVFLKSDDDVYNSSIFFFFSQNIIIFCITSNSKFDQQKEGQSFYCLLNKIMWIKLVLFSDNIEEKFVGFLVSDKKINGFGMRK